jgi:hydrophobic/amphiphilic exporter-1 (mainly G- bacteria), HAE1 family
MSTANFSIKRPIFITCIVAAIVLFGILAFKNLGLDLMPSMDFPTVSVSTTYEGAAPEEIANQITKPLEDQLSSVGGVKHISSTNTEGLSSISIEFNMDVNIDKSLQDVRDKVNRAQAELPDDADRPIVQQFDPDSFPIIKTVLSGGLSSAEMYDLAKETIKPQLSRIDGVGEVSIIGGTRREIQVELDKKKLDEYRLSLTQVVSRLSSAGSNVSIGSSEEGKSKTIFRAMGEFKSLDQISNTAVAFSGDLGRSTKVEDIGIVKDGTEDVTSLGYVYYPSSYKGDKKYEAELSSVEKDKAVPCIYITVTKQSGTNTVNVADKIKKKILEIDESLKGTKGNPHIAVSLDTTTWIRTNVEEAIISIVLGIFFAIIVVYLFLGNIRSTLITAVAIPNSLLGAFIIMNIMGYTLNLMTLMALSLTVGLLVDDAIVVRENIFRKLEQGMSSRKAAIFGTKEVTLAVIATTLTIMSVFLPIGSISGIMGKFLAQFGFTIIFAMTVSLFDALTVAPFLSAYFAGKGGKADNRIVRSFEKFQTWLDKVYDKIMGVCLVRPRLIIIITIIVFTLSLGLLGFVKKTFIPSGGDEGQFAVNFEMPSGTSLQGTKETSQKIEQKLRENIKDLKYYMVTIGDSNGDPTVGEIDIFLSLSRTKKTDEYKEIVRKVLVDFKYAEPVVNSLTSTSSSQMKPFQINVLGHDLAAVEKTADAILKQLGTIPDLAEISSTMKKGNPEFRIDLDSQKMQQYGVSPTTAGKELRYAIAGNVPAQFHADGLEYDIRLRLKPDQRNLRYTYETTRVPNVSESMVPLKSLAVATMGTGSAALYRQDKSYVVTLKSTLSTDGAVGNAMTKATALIKKNVQIPAGVTVGYAGQSEEMGTMVSQIIFVLLLAVVFIYMVLSSLYESFITPFVILLAIPPAMTGALFALFITGQTLDMFSMIGMLLLMGLVTKNSILLVDFALDGVRKGMSRKDAVLIAGRKRLRPIMMTTFAMLAGMLPIALGIGAAAKMRQSMGIAIIGGLIVSTIITLVVVPAVFEYVDKFREFVERRFRISDDDDEKKKVKPKGNK